MLKEFKVGDVVECIEASSIGFVGIVGETYTVSRTDGCSLWFKGYPQGQGHGSSSSRFKLKEGEKKMKFKVGDKVRLTGNREESCNPIGFVGYVRETSIKCYRVTSTMSGSVGLGNWSHVGDLELVDTPVYEDEWQLNRGQDIPDDAEKLMNPDGTSVVAFRYVKKPKVHTATRYVSVSNSKNVLHYQEKNDSAKVKVTYILTDGEITDVQWEKI